MKDEKEKDRGKAVTVNNISSPTNIKRVGME